MTFVNLFYDDDDDGVVVSPCLAHHHPALVRLDASSNIYLVAWLRLANVVQ